MRTSGVGTKLVCSQFMKDRIVYDGIISLIIGIPNN